MEKRLLEQLQWRYAVKRFDATRRVPDSSWQALEQCLEARREQHRDRAVAPRTSEHLGLQRPLACRQEDFGAERLRVGRDAGCAEHGRQRGGAAGEFGLREERRAAELDAFGQAGGMPRVQRG